MINNDIYNDNGPRCRYGYFNLISAPNPSKVKTGLRLRAAHEVSLLTAISSRVIDMEDPDVATESSGRPSAIEKSPLDSDNENPSPPITEGKGTEGQAHETVAPEIPLGNMPATGSASEVSLEEEVAAIGPSLSKKCRRRVNDVADANAPSKPHPEQGMTQKVATIEVQDTHSVESKGLGKSTSSPCMVGSPEVIGEERIRAAFEEFKKYEDDRVEKCCVEIDARLDALSINFDEELYPHMLTAIAGHRWVIGHGLRLAVMKCVESIELKQAFANVVSAGIAKGMSESLAHGIEHGKPGRGLEVMEAYDPEANNKYLQALQELKDLKDPWAIKEDMLLEEAIAANVSRAKKKKMCRVVCRTHEVGPTHHARSDGVPVSVPIISLQGLAILLADAAT
uniref:Transposase (Putative), gypsy type n=1 Tax=Tanacetum cinerariifolium TaxID=118510 RepID=A0A6L2KNW3_TANCI|nr:hypothetical protein [Tanacetum cinerariifolium]